MTRRGESATAVLGVDLLEELGLVVEDEEGGLLAGGLGGLLAGVGGVDRLGLLLEVAEPAQKAAGVAAGGAEPLLFDRALGEQRGDLGGAT
ncbi:MAG: hypothetical protein M0D55_17685 [Elusimicrobiota bacterium]|nr:MAG: hypothetical protein M0D55_17685 [Elusimicrobiota bacterium]